MNNNIENEIINEILPDEPVEVVGVKFKDAGKVYYFSPEKKDFEIGDNVIVKTARGLEFGFIAASNKKVLGKDIVQPLRSVERAATEDDVRRWESNKQLEMSAFETCIKMIAKHKLDMKLIEAEYTFDNSKLLFYFSSEGRVDFRELVKDLASVFHTRIELRQIGIRDEAKMMGGIGVCGRPFCCSSFLSDFVQVSIKMAKEQNLSLNSAKISGTCGRLMCCLRYESEVYEEELKHTPPLESKVSTPDGIGFVKEIAPLSGMCKVLIRDKNGDMLKSFHRDNLTVLSKGEPKKKEFKEETISDEGN
ncbi:MAG: stage 0 sporulation family protein [Clostridia bacterium]|nr:stage 0 sporulation family protein [Clostridia bacterium]